jgi:NAD-dependent SIR2 family protein deacetylase
VSDLHPAPEEYPVHDHRDTYNRQQLNESDPAMFWKRSVERIAGDLQIEPAEAHHLLLDASFHIEKGQVWDWWY